MAGDFSRTARLLAGVSIVALLAAGGARAASYKWNGTPAAPGDWNARTNWTPIGVPTAQDTAVFDQASLTTVGVSQADAVAAMIFNAGAPGYTFNITGSQAAASLNVDGAGITDNS